jgi:hypothetical protein
MKRTNLGRPPGFASTYDGFNVVGALADNLRLSQYQSEFVPADELFITFLA